MGRLFFLISILFHYAACGDKKQEFDNQIKKSFENLSFYLLQEDFINNFVVPNLNSSSLENTVYLSLESYSNLQLKLGIRFIQDEAEELKECGLDDEDSSLQTSNTGGSFTISKLCICISTIQDTVLELLPVIQQYLENEALPGHQVD